MNKLSNLPPGVTDRMIEDFQAEESASEPAPDNRTTARAATSDIEQRRLEAFEEIFRTEPVTIPISGANATDVERVVHTLDRLADRYITEVSLVLSVLKENLPLNRLSTDLSSAHRIWRSGLLDIHSDLVRDVEAIGDSL